MEQDFEELTHFQMQKLPEELLFDPVENRAAVYLNNHRLLTPLASKKLLIFAMAHKVLERGWDESKRSENKNWFQMPKWATLEVRKRCVLIKIQRDGNDAYWRSIPHK